MKSIRTFIIFSLFLINTPFAQVKNIEQRSKFLQWDIQVTSSSYMGVGKTTMESTQEGIMYNLPVSGFIWDIGLSIAVFIIDGLAIEPEFLFNFVNSSVSDDTELTIIGNLIYTFHLPRKNIYPYIKAGYGKSGLNSRSSYNYYGERSEGLFEGLNSDVWNAGLGINVVYSQTTAMRIELNYKNYSNEFTEEQFYSEEVANYKYSTSTLTVLFGFSLIF
ncbi:MAG: hypothetical protein R3321_11695 [Nitrososphaeraceae archaeon]|nr:hypothetical protein [Nitrososphaeraceae archaeon]